MSEEKDEKKDQAKKQRKRLMLLTTVIVLAIVTLIVVLMETTGLGTGAPGSTPSGGATTTTQGGDGSGTLGDANSTSGLPEEQTYAFRQNDIYNGTLLLVDSTHLLRSSIPATELDLYADAWRKDAEGRILYHVRGSARKKLDQTAAEAFVSLLRAYYVAVETPAALELQLSAFDDTTATPPQYTIGLGVRDGRAVSYGLAHPQFADATAWLFANMHRYGFLYIATTETSGYLRYVGIPHAAYMHENDLTLADYLVQIRAYPYTTPLEITVDGVTYAVYYIPARSGGGDFSGSVPKLPHEWSGDNIGGVVVSYQK